MSRTGKASLLIIFVTVFIDLLGFGIVLPLLPRYGRHFDASDRTLGLLMASFSAMQFLFAPIWGRISDRVGRRPILMLGLAGSCVFYALFGFVTARAPGSLWLGLTPVAWLFIARIGAGIAGATIPTAQAYIADCTGPTERAKGMALIGAAFGIGFTFGPLLGAAFVSNDPAAGPSPAAGYVASVLSGIAFLVSIFVLPESLRPDSVPREHRWFNLSTMRTALLRPAVGLVLFTIFLTTFAFAQFESTLSRLTQELGVRDRRNFLLFAYIGLILALSQGVLVRRLLPKLREYKMSFAGTSMMVAGLALIGLAGGHRSVPALCAVLPVTVMGFSAVTPSLYSILSLRTSSSEQGGVLGTGQSMAALARILGPVAGFELFSRNPTYPYWFGSAIMAIGIGLIVLLKTQPSGSETAGNPDALPE